MSSSYRQPEDIIDVDLSVLLRVDPRDEVLFTFLDQHPNPINVRSQINGLLGVTPGFEQLIVGELIDYELLTSNDVGDLSLTVAGYSFAVGRFEKQPTWAEFDLRDGAPQLPRMSVRLSLAIRSMAFQHPSLLDGFLA